MQNPHPVPVTPKRRKWLIALACLALAITLAVMLTRDREPRYKDRILSEWVIDLSPLGYQPTRDKQNAPLAIRTIGTNAIPHLIRFLQVDREPSFVRAAVKWLLQRSPRWVRVRTTSLYSWSGGHHDLARRTMVPTAFEILGPTADSAIPHLEKLLRDQSDISVYGYTIRSLAAIGTNAQPVLLAEMNNPDPVRSYLARDSYTNSFRHSTDTPPQ